MCDLPVLFCSVLQPSSIRGLAASRTTILRCSRFSVALKASSKVIPVHALILSYQAVLGLPRALFPGRLPSMISFSRQSAVFLTIWPKNQSFLATHSFVRFCVHDTRKIFLRHFISKARIRATYLIAAIAMTLSVLFAMYTSLQIKSLTSIVCFATIRC